MDIKYYTNSYGGRVVPAVRVKRNPASGALWSMPVTFYDYTLREIAYKLRKDYGVKFSKLVNGGKW